MNNLLQEQNEKLNQVLDIVLQQQSTIKKLEDQIRLVVSISLLLLIINLSTIFQ